MILPPVSIRHTDMILPLVSIRHTDMILPPVTPVHPVLAFLPHAEHQAKKQRANFRNI